MVIDFLSAEAIEELRSRGECDKMSMHYKMVNGEIYRIQRKALGTTAEFPTACYGNPNGWERVTILEDK